MMTWGVDDDAEISFIEVFCSFFLGWVQLDFLVGFSVDNWDEWCRIASASAMVISFLIGISTEKCLGFTAIQLGM